MATDIPQNVALRDVGLLVAALASARPALSAPARGWSRSRGDAR